MDNELMKTQARQKARMDMREDAPHNPYPINSIQYWAYANEVNRAFTEEFRRAV
jgi:hypothetical protein